MHSSVLGFYVFGIVFVVTFFGLFFFFIFFALAFEVLNHLLYRMQCRFYEIDRVCSGELLASFVDNFHVEEISRIKFEELTTT